MMAEDGIDLDARAVHAIEHEVETALLAHERITDCAVVYQGGHGGSMPRACASCGMPTSYPGAALDPASVCRFCRFYAEHRGEIHAYFGNTEQFCRLVRSRAEGGRPRPDCLLLFSGGKDSTYVLYQLIALGLRVMTFTFDNGFISRSAMRNVEAITAELGIEHVTATRADQNMVFAQSLQRHQSVCNGCFRSLLDLSVRLAWERGIPTIVTGLSRGQIIDERLSWFYRNQIFDPAAIDQQLALGRKVYHHPDGQPDDALNAVQVVDFYRYCDATKQQIRDFLQRQVATWAQPADTGFCSTNCMINDVGVYVHTLERGYHNYEAPTRWEVRLGHLGLDEANRELRAPVNVERVRRMLSSIGYPDPAGQSLLGRRLCAYYVAEGRPTADTLKAFTESRLPAALVPGNWIAVERIPRKAGVVQRDQLPLASAGRFELGAFHDASRPAAESADAPGGDAAALTPAQSILLDDGAGLTGRGSAVVLKLAGPADLVLAKKAVLRLMLRHDALRLQLSRDKTGRWQQRDTGVRGAVPVFGLDLAKHGRSPENRLIPAAAARLLAGLDPLQGAVVRFAFIGRGTGTGDLLIVLHELIADLQAWRLLVRDMSVLWAGVSETSAGRLPPAGSFLRRARELPGPPVGAESSHLQSQERPSTPESSEAEVNAESWLPHADTAAIMAAASASGTPVATFLVAALSAVLTQTADLPAAALDLVDHTGPGARREDGLVGQLADVATVLLTPGGQHGTGAMLGETIRRVRRAGLAPARPPVRLHYFGEDNLAAGGAVPVAGLGPTALRKPTAGRLEIGAVVRSGRLGLQFRCGAPLGKALTGSRVAERVTAWLHDLATAADPWHLAGDEPRGI